MQEDVHLFFPTSLKKNQDDSSDKNTLPVSRNDIKKHP